jgi:hypothetical protein
VIALAGFFDQYFFRIFLRLMRGLYFLSSDNSKTISHMLAVGIFSIYSFIGINILLIGMDQVKIV